MIGKLSGQIIEKKLGKIILDVHGVGYLVKCCLRDWEKASVNQPAAFYIHTHVKEDIFDLYGFATSSDLDIFKLLITVSGVGPKLALNILSNYPSKQIVSAISTANSSLFTSISGIGKKNAQKIILELKSKFYNLNDLDLTDDQIGQYEDLISALQSLGYNTKEFQPLLKKIPPDATRLEDQMRWILKTLK